MCLFILADKAQISFSGLFSLPTGAKTKIPISDNVAINTVAKSPYVEAVNKSDTINAQTKIMLNVKIHLKWVSAWCPPVNFLSEVNTSINIMPSIILPKSVSIAKLTTILISVDIIASQAYVYMSTSSSKLSPYSTKIDANLPAKL